MGIRAGYPLTLHTSENVPLLGRSDLDFIVLKPDWFLKMCSFEFNMVETERFVDVRVGNGVNGSDRSSQPPERAIADDAHATACWKYLVVHTIGNAPGSSSVKDCEDNDSFFKKHTFQIRKKQQRDGFFMAHEVL